MLHVASGAAIGWAAGNAESTSLENPPGTPTGETVLVELDELDTYFTLALVLTL